MQEAPLLKFQTPVTYQVGLNLTAVMAEYYVSQQIRAACGLSVFAFLRRREHLFCRKTLFFRRFVVFFIERTSYKPAAALAAAARCVLGMYDKDPFTFALNVITPVVLTMLGLILPALAKREQAAAKK